MLLSALISALLVHCIDKFQEAMTEEEKAKLYEAIGFSESNVNSTLPKEVS